MCVCVCLYLCLQSFLGFGSSAEIVIELTDLDKRKKVDIKNEEGKKEKLPLYLDGESVSGKVSRRERGEKGREGERGERKRERERDKEREREGGREEG